MFLYPWRDMNLSLCAFASWYRHEIQNVILRGNGVNLYSNLVTGWHFSVLSRFYVEILVLITSAWGFGCLGILIGIFITKKLTFQQLAPNRAQFFGYTLGYMLGYTFGYTYCIPEKPGTGIELTLLWFLVACFNH